MHRQKPLNCTSRIYDFFTIFVHRVMVETRQKQMKKTTKILTNLTTDDLITFLELCYPKTYQNTSVKRHRWVCYSCRLRGPKSVHSGNGRSLLALRHLVSLPVSMPLQVVNHCWSGFPCKWRYINVKTFNLNG